MCESGAARERDGRASVVDRVDVSGRPETRLPDEVLNDSEIERLAEESGSCPSFSPVPTFRNDDLHHFCLGVGEELWRLHRAEGESRLPRLLNRTIMQVVPLDREQPAARSCERLVPGTVHVERIGRVVVEQGLKHRAQCLGLQVLAPTSPAFACSGPGSTGGSSTATDFAFSCCSRISAALLSL